MAGLMNLVPPDIANDLRIIPNLETNWTRARDHIKKQAHFRRDGEVSKPKKLEKTAMAPTHTP